MGFFTHSFETTIARHDYGRMVYHILFLPYEIATTLPFDEYPRLRVSAEVNDYPLEAAFVPYGDGRWYLHIGKRVLKATGLHFGDSAEVRFAIADQDAVDVPEVLQNALEENAEANAAWQTLTPGKKRGYAYRIASAKRPETQIKRVNELFSELLPQ